MKIITKKSVIFAALAVVLLATALVISCIAPLDGISDKEEPSIPGTGKVKLTINTKNTERTILPTGFPSNTRYLLILSGGPGTFYANVLTGVAQSVGNIPVGTYTSVQVIVYTKATALTTSDYSTYALYAIGETAPQAGTYTISATPAAALDLGSFTPVLYTPGTASGNGAGNGTFTYTITDSSSRIASASFLVKGRSIADYDPSGTNTPFPVSYGGIQTVGTDIPSGYYNVIFTITSTDSTPMTAYFYEILHVYKNMESTLTRTFTDAIFPTAPVLPGTGDGEISINIPTLPDGGTFTATLVVDSGSGPGVAVGSKNDYGWKVDIDPAETNAVLLLTITAPASITSYGSWNLVGSATVITIPTGAGIIHSGTTGVTQTYTITINATGAITPLLSTDVNYTTLEFVVGGKSFNTPAIYIEFK